MSFRVASSFHFRFLPMSIFFSMLALGLIGTRFCLPFLIFGPILLFYIPETVHFVKYKTIKDKNLKYLLLESAWFSALLKRLALLGLGAGIISNILIHTGSSNTALSVIILSILSAFLLSASKIGKK